MKQLLLTYLLSIAYVVCFSQYTETGETKHYYFEDNSNQYFEIDTGLNNYEEYNFDNKNNWEYFNIGILGSAQSSLKFNWNSKKGFKDGNIFFNNYKFDIDKIKRFNSSKYPYSEFSYITGSNTEQIVRLTHAQNIKNRFLFGLELYGLSSGGSFAATQRIRNVGISFYGVLSSKNNRLHTGIDLTYSTLKANEIGGIIEDVLIDYKNPKSFYSTQLNDALTKQRTLSIALKNNYDFGFVKFDSIYDTTQIKKYVPVFRFKHKIGTNVTKNSFLSKSNNDSLHLKNFFQYTDSTHRKMQYHNVTNRVAFEYLGTITNIDSIKHKNLRAEISLQHNNIEIWDNKKQLSTNNLMGEFIIQSNTGYKLIYNFGAYYIFTGFNKDDFQGNGKIGYVFKKYGKINISVLYENTRPNWIETFYKSNTINWNNSNFKNKQIVESKINYNLEKYNLKLETSYNILTNYIYFNKNSTPTQTDKKITYWNISAQKNIKYKFLNWNSFVGFQASNNSEILPLPNLFLKTSLYTDLKLFKSNLLVSTGFDLRFNSYFKAKAWNPVISQFYLQDERTMNYTPIVDVFVNAKIKTVRVFAKINYINEGLFVRNYYKALNYPSNGRTYALGASWRFFE